MSVRDIIPWRRRENADALASRDFFNDTFMKLHEDMNKLFDNFFTNTGLERSMNSGFAWSPSVDVKETESSIEVSAELPGLGEDDIEVSLDNDSLVLRGEKREEREENTEGFHRVERSYGSFYRRIPVPAAVDEEKIEAKFEKGVLKVMLPKTEKAVEKSNKIKLN